MYVPKRLTKFISMLCVVALIVTLIPAEAVMAATPRYYDVKFNANGLKDVTNLPKDFSVAAGGTCSIPTQKPSRTGYDFMGYDTSSAAKTVVHTAGKKNVKVTSNLTLYPVWKIKIFKIRLFNSASATTPIATEQYGYNTVVSVASSLSYYAGKVPTGYHREWYNKKTNKKITGSFAAINDVDVYYKDIPNTCTVKLMVDSRSIGTVTLKTGDKMNEVIKNPTKYGHLFVGWGIEKASMLKGVYQPEHICCFVNDGGKATYYAQFLTTTQKASYAVNYLMGYKDMERFLDAYEIIVKEAEAKVKSNDFLNKTLQGFFKGGFKGLALSTKLIPLGPASRIIIAGGCAIAGIAYGNLDYSETKLVDTAWYNRVREDQKLILYVKRQMKEHEERKMTFTISLSYAKVKENPEMTDLEVDACFVH